MGTEWVPTRQNEASGTQTKRDTKSRKVLDFTGFLALHEMIQNAKICARNEKVACSSQVTSSINYPRNRGGFGGFCVFLELFEKTVLNRFGKCLPDVYRI